MKKDADSLKSYRTHWLIESVGVTKKNCRDRSMISDCKRQLMWNLQEKVDDYFLTVFFKIITTIKRVVSDS